MVQIGTLFAVNFDVDKMLIHESRGGFIFEAFPFHHMAPMTAGIANADQYKFVFTPCLFPGRLRPRVPIDGIIGMLEEVGA